jgi:hypothetical protein
MIVDDVSEMKAVVEHEQSFPGMVVKVRRSKRSKNC